MGGTCCTPRHSCFSSDKSRVAFAITMKRLRLYYVVTIVIPVLFLSLTATLVFALPADRGEKMGTSITVLLAFAVYLTIVSDQMPQTSSNVSAGDTGLILHDCIFDHLRFCDLPFCAYLFYSILFYSILGCVLPLQEVALRQSLPSFSVLCCPRPYRSLLSHNVISPTFWSSD